MLSQDEVEKMVKNVMNTYMQVNHNMPFFNQLFVQSHSVNLSTENRVLFFDETGINRKSCSMLNKTHKKQGGCISYLYSHKLNLY